MRKKGYHRVQRGFLRTHHDDSNGSMVEFGISTSEALKNRLVVKIIKQFFISSFKLFQQKKKKNGEIEFSIRNSEFVTN